MNDLKVSKGIRSTEQYSTPMHQQELGFRNNMMSKQDEAESVHEKNSEKIMIKPGMILSHLVARHIGGE